MGEPGAFLTAEWRYLVMFNYEVDTALLSAFVPRGTEADTWQGKTYLSLVGLLFRDTRVLGLGIPYHRNFPEVNLRCYVRYRAAEGWRRGVVFIKEIVPKAAVALIARVIYNENYVALPLRLDLRLEGADIPRAITYTWRHEGTWCRLHAETDGPPATAEAGSQEEFISEHYWGYATQRDGGTLEYQVEHPRWQVWRGANISCTGDVTALYGRELASALAGSPSSAFVANGSPVTVRQGSRVT